MIGPANVLGLQAFRPLLHVELHLFPLIEGAVSGLLDRTVMDEDVLTAITLDKSVAFVVVEPLNCADFWHRLPPCYSSARPRQDPRPRVGL